MVICGGMLRPGSTRVANSPSTSPPRTLTAPISVIDSVCAEPPVVSRSTTTKVTSRNGSPSSSKLRCEDNPGATIGSVNGCRSKPVADGVKPSNADGKRAGARLPNAEAIGGTELESADPAVDGPAGTTFAGRESVPTGGRTSRNSAMVVNVEHRYDSAGLRRAEVLSAHPGTGWGVRGFT